MKIIKNYLIILGIIISGLSLAQQNPIGLGASGMGTTSGTTFHLLNFKLLFHPLMKWN
jgi:hypothetical protein